MTQTNDNPVSDYEYYVRLIDSWEHLFAHGVEQVMSARGVDGTSYASHTTMRPMPLRLLSPGTTIMTAPEGTVGTADVYVRSEVLDGISAKEIAEAVEANVLTEVPIRVHCEVISVSGLPGDAPLDARLGLSALIGMAPYEDADYEEVDAEVVHEWEHEAAERD